jgi:hypothetical protein
MVREGRRFENAGDVPQRMGGVIGDGIALGMVVPDGIVLDIPDLVPEPIPVLRRAFLTSWRILLPCMVVVCR